jgi:hypothetical protein
MSVPPRHIFQITARLGEQSQTWTEIFADEQEMQRALAARGFTLDAFRLVDIDVWSIDPKKES